MVRATSTSNGSRARTDADAGSRAYSGQGGWVERDGAPGDRRELDEQLARGVVQGAGGHAQSRLSLRWVTACGRAASGPSRSTLFFS